MGSSSHNWRQRNSQRSMSVMSKLHLNLLVLVATMAATATVSQGRSIPDYARYPTLYHAERSNDFVRSLGKRSPVTPFHPVNPIISKFGLVKRPGKFTFALPFDKVARKKINAVGCAFTFCKNKKFGLVI